MDRSFMWWIRQHEGRVLRWAFVASLVYFAVGMTCLALFDDGPPSRTITSWSAASEIGVPPASTGPSEATASPAATVVAPVPAAPDTAGDIYKRRCAGTVAVRPGHRARIDASRSMSCAEARRLVRRAVAGTAPADFTCDRRGPGAVLCTANDGREVDATPARG